MLFNWSARLTSGPNDVWQCLYCGWAGVRVTAPEPECCPECGVEFEVEGE